MEATAVFYLGKNQYVARMDDSNSSPPSNSNAADNPNAPEQKSPPETDASNTQEIFDQSPYSKSSYTTNSSTNTYNREDSSNSSQTQPQQYPQNQPHHNQGGYIYSPGPSTTSIVSLTLGILSWIGLSILTAIPGVILSRRELKKIQRKEASEEGRIYAQLGFWFSVVHIALAVLGVAFACCFWGAMSTFFGGALLEMSPALQNSI